MLAPLLFPWPRNGPPTFLILESPLHTVPFVSNEARPTYGARAKFGAFGDLERRIASLRS